MNGAGEIVRVEPAAALPGGEVAIECKGYDTSNLRECHALLAGVEARLVGASPRRVLALVPELNEGGAVEVLLTSRDGTRTQPTELLVGTKLADELHMVANPAFDRDDGALYVTRPGARGQQAPGSLFRI